MSELTYVEGDLFKGTTGDETIFIVHVCNDQGGWGKGFVLPLASAYPISCQAYLAWAGRKTELPHEAIYTPKFELGQVQLVKVQEEGPTIYVANMVAQTLGGDRPLFYNHMAHCMDAVSQAVHGKTLVKTYVHCGIDEPEGRIICPLFGSGLAGGDWNFVEELIRDCWVRQGIEVTVYYLPQFLPKNWTPPPIGDFQVSLQPRESGYTKCNRCDKVMSRSASDHSMMIGGERCRFVIYDEPCSGYHLPTSRPD